MWVIQDSFGARARQVLRTTSKLSVSEQRQTFSWLAKVLEWSAIQETQLTFHVFHMAMHVSVTPLQVACAYSAIANGGLLMEPQLLKSVIANDGTKTHTFKQKKVRRVIKAETALKMREALATVVDVKGTARLAKVEGFSVAGKTGTTIKIHPKGGYYDGQNGRDKRYTVSFAGMMPAENPEFVCVVVIDDPKMPDAEEGTPTANPGGGSVAAPIFSKVASRSRRTLWALKCPQKMPLKRCHPR